MSNIDRSHQLIGDQEFMGDFVDESRELLEAISHGLLQMEEDTEDAEVVHTVFRALHTIKGLSSFVGLQAVNKLSHASENILDNIRTGGTKPTRSVIDSLLKSCDLLSALIDNAVNPADDPARDRRYEEVMAQLGEILEVKNPTLLVVPDVTARSAIPSTDWPAAGKRLSTDLVRQFVAENGDNLQEIEAGLLRLEKHPQDLSTINAVFRPIHSVKGTADYVGLAQIKTLSHHLETVLDLARGARLTLTAQVMCAVFESVDALRSMINDLQPEGEVDRDCSQLIARLLGFVLNASATASPAPALPPSAPIAASPLAIFAQSAGQHVESVRVQSEKLSNGDLSETTLTTLRRSLQTLLNAADYMERHEFLSPCEQILDLLDHLPSNTDGPDETIRSEIGTRTAELEILLCKVKAEARGECGLETALQAPTGAISGSEAACLPAGTSGKAPGPKSMRVEQEKLDEYVNLAGELVIARNTLTHAFRELQGLHGSGLRRLKAAIEGVDRIAATIQDNAMSMRMIPVKSLFQRFPRVVRDIAKAQGKKIDLQVFGEETEIDKQVAEALGDPLVHLIRNSADHGIEPPDARRAAGKPETGMITLKACREGNSVVIEIVDDGAGINVSRLKAKAVEKGVITQKHADTMPREEAINLIFAAGLSTAAKVTDISGRGVGMDVVRTNIKNCGGSVLVTSQEGTGTQLRIELPLTLAVTTALLVVAEEQTYALPIETVKETIKVAPDQVRSLKGHQAVTLRGKIVPLKRLGQMLASSRELNGKRYRSDGAETLKVDATGQVSIVVVDIGSHTFGLVVDAVQERQEIVLKPLPEYLARLPGLGSATVMGDGTIVLILDPADMYAAALAEAQAISPRSMACEPGQPPVVVR